MLKYFKINAEFNLPAKLVLAALPFILCIAVYFVTAHIRHKENPQDKLVPTFTEMAKGFYRSALVPDRNDEYRLWIDTYASARRFSISMALLFFAVILGVNMGAYPIFENLLLRFMLFFDKIPALALLPILFILFGLGELSKIALILIGVFPTITLDTYLRAKSVPREQMIKGQTLDASNNEIVYRIILPQIFPNVLDTIRLNIKAVILFLIAGESLAATMGLGYRIFVVRRYIAMDIIIPYVLWMSLLLFITDMVLRIWIKKWYPWLGKG